MKLLSLLEHVGYEISPGSDPNTYVIRTPFGYIDYTYQEDEDTNQIWWVESNKRGHGTYLIDLMQKHHPASSIAWGITSAGGEVLANKWHKLNPDVQKIEGAHEGQFDPF